MHNFEYIFVPDFENPFVSVESDLGRDPVRLVSIDCSTELGRSTMQLDGAPLCFSIICTIKPRRANSSGSGTYILLASRRSTASSISQGIFVAPIISIRSSEPVLAPST